MHLLVTYAVISSQPVLLLHCCDIWYENTVNHAIHVRHMTGARCYAVSTAITGLLIINLSLMENIFLVLFLSDCFPIMFLKIFHVFKMSDLLISSSFLYYLISMFHKSEMRRFLLSLY